jgi:hypothetical protein
MLCNLADAVLVDDPRTDEERQLSAFFDACEQMNLDLMRRTWRLMGSPCLHTWRAKREGTFGSWTVSAFEVFYGAVERRFMPYNFDYGVDVRQNGVPAIENHLRFFQQEAGWRFNDNANDESSTPFRYCTLLADACDQGLDLTGCDLIYMRPGVCHPQHSGSLDEPHSMTALLFSGPRHLGENTTGLMGEELTPNGPARLDSFLRAGADMWPLSLPGASAACPPPGLDASALYARVAGGPESYNDAEYWAAQAKIQALRVFWPDQFGPPARFRSSGSEGESVSEDEGGDSDGEDDGAHEGERHVRMRRGFPFAAAEIVEGVCKTAHATRRSRNWARRRLALMCCLRSTAQQFPQARVLTRSGAKAKALEDDDNRLCRGMQALHGYCLPAFHAVIKYM